MDGLNPEQRAAATLGEGPALVLAGPGTGKTTTLVARFVTLVERGVPPSRILAVTFTAEAARQMRERLAERLREPGARLAVGTFHARCLRWLREDPGAFGLDGGFEVLDDSGQFRLLRELGFARAFDLEGLRDRIGRFKDALVTPAEAARQATGRKPQKTKKRSRRDQKAAREEADAEAVALAYQRYQDALERRRLMDFGDMVVAVVDGLQSDVDLRARIAGRFDHVLVDEYQDINRAQHELIRLLAGGHRNLWAVGDDDQAIYGWRGSDVRYLTGFAEGWRPAEVVRLQRNYRSHPTVLTAAGTLIAANYNRLDKRLTPVSTARTQIAVTRARGESDEAAWIARSVRKLVDAGAAKPGDVAVLVRAGAQMVHLESALAAVGVDYELRGGRSFWHLPEVRNVEDGLRVVYGLPEPAGREAPRWLRQLVADRAGHSAGKGLKVAARAVAAVVADKAPRGMKEERRNQWHAAALEVSRIAATFDDVGGFLAHAEGERRARGRRRHAARDRVVVSTIHQAKGLEWDAVFVAGFEQGLLPVQGADDLSEERRLAYVAVTRARRWLAVSWADARDGASSGPSPYLDDLLQELEEGQIRRVTWPEGWTPPVAPAPNAPGEDLSLAARVKRAVVGKPKTAEVAGTGERVRHPRFGVGEVLARRGGVVTVCFDDGSVRRIVASFLLDA